MQSMMIAFRAAMVTQSDDLKTVTQSAAEHSKPAVAKPVEQSAK